MDKEQIDAHVRSFTEEENADPQTAIIVTPEDDEGDQAEIIEGEVTFAPPLPHVPILKRRISLLWILFCAFLAFLITSLIMVFLIPIFTLHAAITLIPEETLVNANLTLPNVEGHIFKPISLSASSEVAATGKGHQNASFAIGEITFYNAASISQTIDTGTLLTGMDGIQVVTDSTAIIPAGNAPIEGQVSVPAHALTIGVQGNIAAYDINGACCRENIFVKNISAFVGGVNARDFHIVTKSDMNAAVSSITPKLVKSIEIKAQGQVSSADTLVTPLSCISKMSASPNVGEEASRVNVFDTQTCTPVSYSSARLLSRIQTVVQEQITKRIGTTYRLLGAVKIAIIHTAFHTNSLSFTVSCQAHAFFSFNQAEKEAIRNLVAGKSREQAMLLLSRFPGVSQAAITLSSGTMLPQDPNRIKTTVSYRLMKGNASI